jgi:hypothetical protein
MVASARLGMHDLNKFRNTVWKNHSISRLVGMGYLCEIRLSHARDLDLKETSSSVPPIMCEISAKRYI